MTDFYYAVIERPDNTTYEQLFKTFHDLELLISFLGDDYKVVAIY